jgi:site-specific DNA-methyltransferase (adenine-specific)
MNPTDRIRITNEDNMALMARYPDKYFDLAIVDPPYGIGESGSNNHTRGELAVSKNYKPFHGDDLESPSIEYFAELIRVSNNQIIWGANHYISKIPYDSPCWVVWDKDNGETDFADCELAWTSHKTAVRRIRFRWQGMLQQDMKNKEHRIHPTQKPVALYKWLLKNYATPDMKILDTHLGSGSIAIACHEYGCDLTACELDTDYYEASIKRIQNHINQTNLFIE